MINSDDYKFIADGLGAVYSEGRDMANAIGDMKAHLRDNALSDVNVEKQILERQIDNTYLIVLRSHVGIDPSLADMIQALQGHVEKRYGSLDEFLQDKGIKVTQEFADLSSICGFEISMQNIE